MKTEPPRHILCRQHSSLAVRERTLCGRRVSASAISILGANERAPANDFKWPKDLEMLTLSTITTAVDFPVQLRNRFAKI
jgi:hypothetical protein